MDIRLNAFQIDEPPVAEFPEAEVSPVGDLLGEELGILAAGHSTEALRCALLGPLTRRLIERWGEPLLYLSPRLRVTASLAAIVRALDGHEAALVARPQYLVSARSWSADRDAGTYSQDVIGFGSGEGARALANSWPAVFQARAGDGARGACAAWIESLPARLPQTVIIDGMDILADGRALAGAEPEYRMRADTPLLGSREVALVDLGDIDPDDPLSRLGASPLRANHENSAALAAFLRRHAADLRAAGVDQALQEHPSYEHLADGLRLTETIRSLVNQAVIEHRLIQSPFRERGRRELYEYLNEPASSGSSAGLTRLHLAIWSQRADLREAYPHLEGPDGPGFAGWLCVHGPEQEGLTQELLPPEPDHIDRDAAPSAQMQPQRFGVNLVGFFNSELGVGEMARLFANGLDEAQVPFLPVQGRLRPPSRAEQPFQTVSVDEATFPLNIICINGDGIPVFAREAGRSFFRDRYSIALWWWEVGAPPASWDPAYELVDEVWVGTRYVYDLIAPTAPTPVVQMPVPIEDIRRSSYPQLDLGLPEDGFVFLSLYDYNSVLKRKNPGAVIAAFRRAFEGVDGVHLVLKSVNGTMKPSEHARVLMEAGDQPTIRVIDGYLSRSETHSVLAACDCYVSLHRAEGFGLTLAEAMLLEKPVIATRFGGNVDFMSDKTAYLVDYTLTAVGDDAYPYSPNARWAEPSIDHAAALMRQVFEQQQEARSKGAQAREELLRSHSAARVAGALRARLELIHERELTHQRPNPARLSPLPLPSSPPSVHRSRPNSSKRRLWGPARRMTRAVLQRLDVGMEIAGLRDETEQLRGEAEQLRAALAQIDERLRGLVRGLDERSAFRYAELLSELRALRAGSRKARGSVSEATRSAEAMDGAAAPERAER
jgi:glycosyltransferase involved in cell wall biosynthesis